MLNAFTIYTPYRIVLTVLCLVWFCNTSQSEWSAETPTTRAMFISDIRPIVTPTPSRSLVFFRNSLRNVEVVAPHSKRNMYR